MARKVLTGVVLDERCVLSLGELCRTCEVHADWLIELVEEGVLEPEGRVPADWRFSGVCVQRVQVVQRLQRDLGVNLAGAALALELMNELETLRARLAVLEDRE